MTEQLHKLIDSGAHQSVINERVAGLIETTRTDLARIGSDHERRIRFLERAVNYSLGVAGAISLALYILSFMHK